MNRIDEILGLVQEREKTILRDRWERERRKYVTTGQRERQAEYRRENADTLRQQQRNHDRKNQTGTTPFAHRRGQPWTTNEDEALTSRHGRTLYQIAIELGRTWRECKDRARVLRRQ